MKKLLTLAIAVLLSAATYAQIEAPVKWGYGVKKINATEAYVLVQATIEPGWHIYSLNQKDGGPVKTSITFTPSKEFSLIGTTVEPKPITKFEKAFGMNVLYFEKTVTFQQKVKLKGGQAVVKGKLEYMTCNDQKCLPPDDLDFSVTIK